MAARSADAPGVSGRPLRADARRNQKRLLAAARHCFAEEGVTTSLETVARRAGVGVGTLYRHFPNRFVLVEAMLTDDVERLRSQAALLLTTTTPAAAVETWLRAASAHIATYAALLAGLGPHAAAADEVLSGCCDGLAAPATQLLARAWSAGELRDDVDADDLLRLVQAIVVAGDLSQDRVDRLLTIMCDGLRPRHPEARAGGFAGRGAGI